MTPDIRPLIAGNWKMNGTRAELPELRAIADGFAGAAGEACDGLVCLPATLVGAGAEAVAGSRLGIGGQDCHPEAGGAHTGDIAAEMLKDCGAGHVIVGHSERRTDHAEDDAMVAGKAQAAWRAGLVAIICIGETRAEREAGEALDVLSRQVKGSVPAGATAENTVVAYEPVWAIGTGLTPTVEDIAEAHTHIRRQLGETVGGAARHMRLLYGGSVKPSNAGDILAIENVDGALVGGASLKAADFLGIASACKSA